MFDNTAKKVDLGKILLQHERDLLTQLGARDLFDHPTAKGDLGEGAWHRLLGDFLPRRYQVSKAFVLDARGETSEQIDLVIHDRHFCPLLFEEDDQRFIPAESVFAVFEVKPNLKREVIRDAVKKARSVRGLHRTDRELVERGVVKPPRGPFPIIAGVLAVESDWSPPFGDPLSDALTTDDVDSRLQFGCTPKHGAFEASYGTARPDLEVSGEDGALMFFLLHLFHQLQVIGSPMGIDLREYARPLTNNAVAEQGGATVS